jgi:hypothetical protein
MSHHWRVLRCRICEQPISAAQLVTTTIETVSRICEACRTAHNDDRPFDMERLRWRTKELLGELGLRHPLLRAHSLRD